MTTFYTYPDTTPLSAYGVHSHNGSEDSVSVLEHVVNVATNGDDS